MKNYVDKDKLQEYTTKLNAKMKTIFATKSEVGSPLVASTVAEMTDTSRIYVYTGSESGYTSGNWYYYNGSEWASGGVYNSTAFETDATLAIPGAAADAKATGDAIGEVEDEVSDLKTQLNHGLTAPEGYILTATDTGNGTEWSPVGLPTDAQTAEAVTAWLNLHPEATTTVQNDSLTEAKFTDTLKLKTIKDYVTPEMFGAKGDGVTDDTSYIQNCLNSNKPVLLTKNYLISSPLTISKNANIDGNQAKIIVSDNFIGEYAILISGQTTTRMTFIKNLYVDCAGKNIYGIFLNAKRVTLSDCIVQFCGGIAYYIEEAGGSHVVNCSATNIGVSTASYTGEEFANSTALKNNSADVYIDTFDFIDFKTGIEHVPAFGFYNNIHGFVLRYLDYIWNDSCFFKTSANYNYCLTLINSYPDSQQYAFMMQGSGNINIIGGATFVNNAVWNGTTRTPNNTYIYKRVSGNIKTKFDSMTIKGSNTDQINFTDTENNIAFVAFDNCQFNNVINTFDNAELDVPTFEGRTYQIKAMKREGENIRFHFEFSFSPSTQGAITNSAQFASMSSMNYVGRIPSSIVNVGYSVTGHEVINACYFNKLTGTDVKVYPLIAYRSNSGIYIRPLENDTLITDSNNSNTYYVFVSGTVNIGSANI